MRRVNIFWPCVFPHGGALSNYIECLAKALAFEGYCVSLFVFCKETNYDSFNRCPFRIIDISSHSNNKFIKRLNEGRVLPLKFARIITKLKPTKNDLFITRQESGIDRIILFFRKIYRYKTCTCPLEWYSKEFFNSKHRWIESKNAFIRNKKHDLILPISRNIDLQFKDFKVHSLILPPMVDIKEYQLNQGLSFNTIEFVFSANGAMKDSLNNMLEGICLLKDDDLSKAYFHFTGVKEENAKKVIGEKRWIYLKNHLMFHPWMEYNELVNLYHHCHYLYLAREKNQMTISNFPSKIPEAMALGIVPVVSRVGDYADIYLNDGTNCIFIEGSTSESCAEKLHTAINLGEEKYHSLSRAARKTAETKFDYTNWSSKIKKCIESLYQ